MNVSSMLQGRCPKCDTGKIFASKGSIFKMKVPQMNETCSHCGYRFARESGYFLGAMYVSYGLTIAEMLPLFLVLAWYVSLTVIFVSLFVMLVLTMFFNFRMSRIIWVHLFHK